MNRQSLTEVAVSPLTPEQRQRLESVTAVRGLFPSLLDREGAAGVIDLALFIATGRRP